MTQQWVAIDIETTGLSFKKDKILCIALCHGEQSLTVVSYDESALSAAAEHIKRLKDDGAKFVFHNGKFDVKFIREHLGLNLYITADTQYAAPLLIDRGPNNKLESLTSLFLGISGWKEDVNFNNVSAEQLRKYCETDAKNTMKLWKVMSQKLEQEGVLNFYKTKLMPFVNLLSKIEFGGIRIDLTKLQNLLQQFNLERIELDNKLRMEFEPFVSLYEQKLLMETISKLKNPGESASPVKQLKYTERVAERTANPPRINFSSPKQVLWVLMDGYGLSCRDRKGKMSVAEGVLQDIYDKHKGIGTLLRYREIEKYISFLERWKEDQVESRLYTTYNVDVTKTGRLSSSEPNLQQVPINSLMRSIFIPENDKTFVVMDFAQIEPRIAALYSKDKNLLSVFKKDIDFYGAIAVQFLKADCHPNEVKEKFPILRKVAKEVGLSILYGIGPYKLANRIKHATGIDYSLEETKQIIEFYFEVFPGLLDLGKRAVNEYSKYKKITNIIGRPLFPEDGVAHKVVNMLIQSSASDLCLLSILRTLEKAKEGGIQVSPKLVIHDEVVYEIRNEDVKVFKDILRETTTTFKLEVPIRAEIGERNTW